MRHTILVLLLALGACDRAADDTQLREGTTGAAEPEMPPCECDPEADEPCGAGLQCVPIGDGHACLAPCSGLTLCQAACVYPFASEKGTGPAFCASCVTCAPVDPAALICQ